MESAVQSALNHDRADLLENYISNGLDVDMRLPFGRTLLMVACNRNKLECVKMLTRCRANVNAMSDGGSGFCPLHYALFLDDEDGTVVRTLLRFNALPDIGSATTATPLQFVIANRWKQKARMLLYAGAKMYNVKIRNGLRDEFERSYARCRFILKQAYAALLYGWKLPRDLVREVCKRIWAVRFDLI